MVSLKSRLKFEIIGNRYLVNLISYYLNVIKPYLKDIRILIGWKLGLIKFVNYPLKDRLLNFNVTNICNGRCVFCAYRYLKDKKQVMSFEIFRKALDEYKKAGGRVINLTPLMGEALIDKGLFKKIVYAKKQGIRVELFSNGLLLNMDENYKRLIDSGIDDLSISVGDVNPLIDSRIFGISVSASKMRWKGIHKLIDYAIKKGFQEHLHILFRPERKPYDIIKDPLFAPLLNKLGRNENNIKFLLTYDNWAGMITRNDLRGIMGLRRPLFNNALPCRMISYSLSIGPDGDIRLCGCRARKTVRDELVVGNIKKMTLKEAINSPRLKSIRDSFARRNPPAVCRKCSFYNP